MAENSPSQLVSQVGERPDMMSASVGEGGGHGKADVGREVTGIL